MKNKTEKCKLPGVDKLAPHPKTCSQVTRNKLKAMILEKQQTPSIHKTVRKKGKIGGKEASVRNFRHSIQMRYLDRLKTDLADGLEKAAKQVIETDCFINSENEGKRENKSNNKVTKKSIDDKITQVWKNSVGRSCTTNNWQSAKSKIVKYKNSKRNNTLFRMEENLKCTSSSRKMSTLVKTDPLICIERETIPAHKTFSVAQRCPQGQAAMPDSRGRLQQCMKMREKPKSVVAVNHETSSQTSPPQEKSMTAPLPTSTQELGEAQIMQQERPSMCWSSQSQGSVHLKQVPGSPLQLSQGDGVMPAAKQMSMMITVQPLDEQLKAQDANTMKNATSPEKQTEQLSYGRKLEKMQKIKENVYAPTLTATELNGKSPESEIVMDEDTDRNESLKIEIVANRGTGRNETSDFEDIDECDLLQTDILTGVNSENKLLQIPQSRRHRQSSNSSGGPGFSPGGGANSQKSIIFLIIC